MYSHQFPLVKWNFDFAKFEKPNYWWFPGWAKCSNPICDLRDPPRCPSSPEQPFNIFFDISIKPTHWNMRSEILKHSDLPFHKNANCNFPGSLTRAQMSAHDKSCILLMNKTHSWCNSLCFAGSEYSWYILMMPGDHHPLSALIIAIRAQYTLGA